MTEPLGNHAVLGDLHTIALVGDDGALDWLCLPRFDSPACFAALTGDAGAGTWLAGPAAGGRATRRRYRPGTLVLESEWDTPDGTVRLVDCMPPRDGAARVVRVLEGVRGRTPVRVLFEPRFDHGQRGPWTRCTGRTVTAVAGADALRLDADVPFEPVGTDGAVEARFSLAEGQRARFVLTHTPSHLTTPAAFDADAAIVAAERFWGDWSARTGTAHDDVVRRALITLKALTYAPTGAVVTTPVFTRGAERHLCDPLEAPAILTALLGAGLVDEARAWRGWLLRAAAGDPGDVAARYSVDGQADRSAADGRAGLASVLYCLNATDALWAAPRDPAWDLQLGLLDHLAATWDRPGDDNVHAKVMAWAAFDRAVRTAERHDLPGPADHWRTLRSRIRADVCAKGFAPERNTFVRDYGSDAVDPALLVLPAIGFLPWRDVRVRGTVAAIAATLSDDTGLVPGTPLSDGFRLVSALHGTGYPVAATALFDELLAVRNDVGLFGARYDPGSTHAGPVPDTAATTGVLTARPPSTSDHSRHGP
ncbi:glycoside hydrolase family 15 protein [Actinophytocola sp. KF-1]